MTQYKYPSLKASSDWLVHFTQVDYIQDWEFNSGGNALFLELQTEELLFIRTLLEIFILL
jgi:hypothetical protein